MTLFRRSVLALPFSPSCSGRHLAGFPVVIKTSRICVKFALKRDNVVWNDFRAHFQDNQDPFFVLFGEVVKIYHYIYSGFLKGNKIVSKRSKILGLSYLL